MAFIEVSNLKYRYPHTKTLALDGINLSIEKGEFIGIAGENKAGKSTLCQSFAGLIPTMFKGAYGGKILIGKKNAAETPIAELCQSVGLVFQNPFNQLSGAKETVFDEIAFGLQNLGVPREEMIKRVRDNLKLLDIEKYAYRNPFDLSGGQIQRVAIASILAMNPELIVLDEPTSQLDPQGSEEVFKAVEKLTKSGITIIMAEHKMEKLASYCDKILLLHKGKQIAFDTPEYIFSRDDLDSIGVLPPVYTQVCKTLSISKKSEKDKIIYPVTFQDVEKLKGFFPEHLVGRITSSEDDSIVKNPVFQIEHLSFSYNPMVSVIEDVNLTFRNEPTAIIGQNGAGKTTLVKLLKGLIKPASGSILFERNDTKNQTVAQLSAQIGYVFQNPDDQIFKNKVMDEIMVGPLNLGWSKTKAKESARDALEMVGLIDKAEQNPYDLDLSERKLIAVASVIAMNPKVLILDEPTIAQDVKGKEIIGKLITSLFARGKLIITILHDMDFAAKYFNRIIVMAHGKILADGPKEEVFYRTNTLKQAHLEQPHVTSLCRELGYEGVFLDTDDLNA
ncbi:energy-coupling factor ABC transporter ATP-binding protein [Blautia liquoris]|uniref:Energy-coupling factor ABC transporter ATP-binding protein n=1 Tax=Blautia liquoris TaxID=2779518 RepID=A0A7M2RJQ4_9FIRM|nr:ABC transporter ATP-binding protein [Blautia liquoris]QOV20535.1 energy-coupling factor ABC transporter ATP-binding protein [Blautia liquoris]